MLVMSGQHVRIRKRKYASAVVEGNWVSVSAVLDCMVADLYNAHVCV